MIHDLAFAGLLVVAAMMLVAAAVSDLRQLWIPDRYCVGIILAFVAGACVQPLAFAVGGVATGVLVFAIGVAVFARGWLGGGDVKLLSSIALWAGPDALAPLLFNTALAGAVLALAMLLRLHRRTPANWRVHAPLQQPMPFAVAIAASGVAQLVSRWPWG